MNETYGMLAKVRLETSQLLFIFCDGFLPLSTTSSSACSLHDVTMMLAA